MNHFINKMSFLVGLLVFGGTSSCSVHSLAMSMVGDILGEASGEIETEDDWQIFKEAMPGLIKTIEGLAYTDPENEALLVSLIKAYAAYGFGVFETQYLAEKYSDAAEMPFKQQALHSYRRAIDYGLRILKIRGITLADLQKALQDNRQLALLDSQFNGDDLQDIEGLFFLGQSWLGYINLQRDKPELVAQISLVKGFIDWACQHKPDFKQGACDIFTGAYEASRPAMLGGNPEKAQKLFQEAMAKYPDNLLIRVAFLENYVIPRFDEAQYQQQKKAILAAHRANQQPALPGSDDVPLAAKDNKGQLFNSIALQRFRVIRQYEKDLF